jgi:hypothetical protein
MILRMTKISELASYRINTKSVVFDSRLSIVEHVTNHDELLEVAPGGDLWQVTPRHDVRRQYGRNERQVNWSDGDVCGAEGLWSGNIRWYR